MKRVLVIGCCGAGKSTFASKLANSTKLPLVHLDKEYFLPNWVCPSEDEWQKKVLSLIAADSWIIEGNYAGSLETRLTRADTVIILAYPLWKCLCRILKRVYTSYGKVRPDMAPHCPERFDFDFIKYVLNFPKNIQPKIDAALKVHPEVRQIILRNDRETAHFLAETAANERNMNHKNVQSH